MTGADLDPTSKSSLAQAIGRLSSGVYVVTVESNNQNQGMLATWIMQASFNPPMLSLAIHRQREILHQLGAGARFCVNTLADRNRDIFKAFAAPGSEQAERFRDLKLAARGSAGPVFVEALSYVDCTVREQIAAGDHIIVIAEITSGEILGTDKPMLHTRKNGFCY